MRSRRGPGLWPRWVTAAVLLAAIGFGPRGAGAGEGVSGADFLQLPNGARSTALAGAYAALGGDAESLFDNPAGMAELLNPQIYLSHLAWWDAVSYDAAWGVQPLGTLGALGLAVTYLNVPSFNSTEQPDLSSSAWGGTLTGGYAVHLGRDLALGGSLRLVASSLESRQAWGGVLDLGAKAYLLNDQLTLAGTVRNLGALTGSGSAGDRPPMQAGLGASYQLWPDEPHRLALAAEGQLRFREAPELALGAEGWLWNLLAVRAGARPTAQAGEWLTVGAGVRWQQFHLDYAWSPLGRLGATHHLSAGYDFARQVRLGHPKLRVRVATKQTVSAAGESGYEVDFMPTVEVPAGLEEWSVEIFNRAGQRVQVLSGSDPMPLILPWDGRDEQGRTTDMEAYYLYRFRVTDRLGYTASAQGEILPRSITQLPQLKVLPRDIFAGKVSFQPKVSADLQEWSVSIVNAQGEVVKKYQGMGAFPKNFCWDGTDAQGRQIGVQEGYHFILNLKDRSGNEAQTTAPLVQVEAHSKALTTESVAVCEDVPFRFRLPADMKLQSWALDIVEASGGRVVRTYTGQGRPPETLTWNACDAAGQPLPTDQRYGYVLRMQDRMGNIWQQAADLSVTEVKVLPAPPGQLKLKIEQILFDFAKAELKPNMVDKLMKTADLARSLPPGTGKVIIEGHTDEVGTDEFNITLSLQRANMVMRYLVEEEGLPSAVMEVKGYGKTVPFAVGEDALSHSLNRRVEITVVMSR